jgi:hypothetical protein
MGEYAVVVSTIASVLILALNGLGQSLPSSAARASAVVSRAATGANVSVTGAKQALRHAPFKRHQLRTLYGLGWIAGSRDRATCLVATSTGTPTVAQTRRAFRQVRDWNGLLRRSKVAESAAVDAIDRGFRASCS